MKKILGLDLGITSIGWALVEEAENESEKSSIIKLGVRVNPLTTDEQNNFEQGKSITTNADRQLRRSARRNKDRYHLRRSNLKECLEKAGIISSSTCLAETGKNSTFHTLQMRARAVTEEVPLEDFARILFLLNKKRGYKSNRKAQAQSEEGQLIDGMDIAKLLHERHITPGQYVCSLLKNGSKFTPSFYASDLKDEFERIWEYQKSYHMDWLTDDLHRFFDHPCTKAKTLQIFRSQAHVEAANPTMKDKRKEKYGLRAAAVERPLSAEELVAVLADINGEISNSSKYLGAISDRSKTLYFQQQTVGQYLMEELSNDRHFSVKKKTFYRQDYLDEFDAIWKEQSRHHSELTHELYNEIRNHIIFYQRPLKSKKGLVSTCALLQKTKQVTKDGKTQTISYGPKACPKASPLFQEFQIWQSLGNLRIIVNGEERSLTLGEKESLAHELAYQERLSRTDIIRHLFGKARRDVSLNMDGLQGNLTLHRLFKAFLEMVAISGHMECDIQKMSAQQIEETVKSVFSALGFPTDLLDYDALVDHQRIDDQPLYRLWHLLYSYEGDNSTTGNDALIDKLQTMGFPRQGGFAQALVNLTFPDGYGRLSAKAIRLLLPHMKQGMDYSEACEAAGLHHSSRSLTREELEQKEYVNHLQLLPQGALRNPIVEKILNQMIHVINGIVETYGKPDEIRIELARELKKNSEERQLLNISILNAKKRNEQLTQEIMDKCHLSHVSHRDLLRYRLYKELENNGYHTLYSNTYIPLEKLFGEEAEFDIEHIIPQSRLFDDSFSNKTLELRSVNQAKSNSTAYDYILHTHGEEAAAAYTQRIHTLFASGHISKAKHDKLLMRESDIPQDFIERDLRNSQYIATKARELLEEMVMFVVPTTGSITDRLRQDWQLVDVLQELNWEKYHRLGLTETYVDHDGRSIRRIKNWTKRNDHRHHAMDALTIAFTSRGIIQYLNHLNARTEKSSTTYALEKALLYRDNHHRLRFRPPMPLDTLRAAAKQHLENVLVSIKAKNKVMTGHINAIHTSQGTIYKRQLTPRGQLHNETIYAHTLVPCPKWVKVNASMTIEMANQVTKPAFRQALLKRLAAHGNDPKKAFAGSNSPAKNPIWINDLHTLSVPNQVKVLEYVHEYPVRKDVSPDLKIDKVIDPGVRRVLQARLAEYGNDPKKAFVNLDENPIWLNRNQGICIKHVRIRGVQTAIPLHSAKDHMGHTLHDADHRECPVDYVQTSGNHHVAIFRDSEGKLQDVAVSFWEASERYRQHLPIIDRNFKAEEGWQFLFTMKRNEYFVFPAPEEGFFPNEIDLLAPSNYDRISPHLFRVQYTSKVCYGNSCVRDYGFRHHLETNVENPAPLKGITYLKAKSLASLEGIVKVRVNHLGEIVSIGEY